MINVSYPYKLTYQRWIKPVLVLLLLAPVLLQAQSYSDTVTLEDLVDTSTIQAPVADDDDPPAVVAEDEYDDDSADENVKGNFELRANASGDNDLEALAVRRMRAADKQRFTDDEAFWYANRSFAREAEPEEKSMTRHPAFQTALWIIIVCGFGAFVIIYLANSNVGIFRRSRNIKQEEGIGDMEDIFGINYPLEIEKAVDEGNYRFAVRLLFLQQLRKMADKRLIDYTADRTNLDYLMQLQPTKWYPDFFRLTRNYEYSWYGLFDIDLAKFQLIRNDFDTFNQKLGG